MPREYDDELKTECAGWVAEQLSEEGVFMDPPLIFMLLNMEEHVRATSAGGLSTTDVAAGVATLAADEGVRSEPSAIDAAIILRLLSWEDEFLSFAGIPRQST